MTDPTPERRWTLELAEGFALFRNSYGGAYSTDYEPDLEGILATLNETETLRERVRVLEAQALEMRSALREVAESSIDDHWLRDRCARALAGAETPDHPCSFMDGICVWCGGLLLDSRAGAEGGERRGG